MTRADFGQRLTGLNDVRYLASHPTVLTRYDKLDFGFYTQGVWVRRKREFNMQIPWAQISRFEVLSQSEVESLVTLKGVLALGVLAWLAKKNRVVSFIEITDAQGVWTFAVPGIGLVDLRSGLRPIMERYVSTYSDKKASVESTIINSTSDVQNRLQRLEQLHLNGVITTAEYESKRAAIINEL